MGNDQLETQCLRLKKIIAYSNRDASIASLMKRAMIFLKVELVWKL